MTEALADGAAVIIIPAPHSLSDREDGDNSRSGHEDDAREEHPLGTGELSLFRQGEGLDPLVDLAEVERRFRDASRVRLKPRPQRCYLQAFMRFAKSQRLADVTRRQLAGPMGKRLLLRHLETIPRPSWATTLAALRGVWTMGLGLPWPIDNKADIGRLPRVRRDPTPSDALVREWAEALSRERDPYLRLAWLLIAQTGWRPSHATGMRWSDVRYGVNGRPEAIMSIGARGEFKSFAPVAVRLPDDVAKALEEWRRAHPPSRPEAWILPWRPLKRGHMDPDRRMETDLLRAHWDALRRKYGLQPLRPKDLRHWVSTQCRKAGLSKAATAYAQGHDATDGGTMRDWYDNPHVEEILEEQRDRLPRGPLGMLMPVEVELVADRPAEAMALLDAYLDGRIGTMELAVGMEKVRLKAPRFPEA